MGPQKVICFWQGFQVRQAGYNVTAAATQHYMHIVLGSRDGQQRKQRAPQAFYYFHDLLMCKHILIRGRGRAKLSYVTVSNHSVVYYNTYVGF